LQDEIVRSHSIGTVVDMPCYVLRLWLPDRPGALGAVASRIGAIRGDLVGIDIVERGAGRAIDELVVVLPDPGLVDLLLHEVSQVDGVDVEDLRAIADAGADPRLSALETAARLVAAACRSELLALLCHHARHDFTADWSAVIELDSGRGLESAGLGPTDGWLAAFVAGSRASARTACGNWGPDGVGWSPMPGAGLALVVGRDGRPLRSRERKQLAALARIADSRAVELGREHSRARHPSSG
jgi:hypothetical protein